MKIEINSKIQDEFEQELKLLIDRLDILAELGYDSKFLDSRIGCLKGIGYVPSHDFEKHYERTPYGYKLSFLTFSTLLRQYENSFDVIKKYNKFITEAEYSVDDITENIERVNERLDYDITDFELNEYISLCSEYLNYPIKNEVFPLFIENIYKIIKIEYQHKYTSEMLRKISSYMVTPFDYKSYVASTGDKDKTTLDLYNMFNKLLKQDFNRYINSGNEKIEKYLDNDKDVNIYNKDFMNLLVSCESNDFSTIDERIEELENILELCSKSSDEEKVGDNDSDVLTNFIKKVFNRVVKKQSNKKEVKAKNILMNNANFNNISEGVYIVPLMMFRNSPFTGEVMYTYEVKQQLDLCDIRFGDDNIPYISSSHVLVKVDKNNPEYVTEILTGIEIPITYHCKLIETHTSFAGYIDERYNKVVDSCNFPTKPCPITIEMDVVGKYDGDNNKKTISFTSEFCEADNINILSCSDDIRAAVFDKYSIYHGTKEDFTATISMYEKNSREEYYRYLRDRLNAGVFGPISNQKQSTSETGKFKVFYRK